MKWALPLLFVGAGTLGFAIHAHIAGSSTRHTRAGASGDLANGAPDNDVTALRDEVATLTAQLQRIDHTNGVLAAAITKAGAAPVIQGQGAHRPPPRSPEEIAEREAQARARRQEQMQAIGAKLAKEKVDREWTNAIETEVQSADGAELERMGVSLKATDCHETICRLDFEVKSDSNPDDLMMLVSRLPGAKSGVIEQVPGADGRLVPVVYVTRAAQGFREADESR